MSIIHANCKDNYHAFFDVDGTILNTRSVLSFLEYMCEALMLSDDGLFLDFRWSLYDKLARNEPREDINRFYYTWYKGMSVASVSILAEEWFNAIERRGGIYNEEIIDEIERHRRLGASIVLATGSFPQILDPLVRRIPVDAILCSRPKMHDGLFTGELDGPPCIGAGKAHAVIEFSRQNNVDLSTSFGYGDDSTDIPMLELLGHPCKITPTDSYRVEFGKYVNAIVGDQRKIEGIRQ
jgi:HAD superfamily hydrolase (TIGR01490 family)